MKIKAVIKPDGSLQAIYNDAIISFAPGPLEVTRVSNVEFHHVRQVWEAIRPDGSVMCSHPLRDQCLELEKQMAERELLEGS